jgi:hypothetical protein
MSTNRTAVAALASGAALLLGGGAALAAQGDGPRAERCQERLARIAERRGVTVEQLEANMKARLTARVDAALAAGRISPERAAKLKGRIARAELCTRAGVPIQLARGVLVRAAARYLELTPAELRAQLPGASLAALAAAQGKSVEDLRAAMLAPAKARLARAVASGRIGRPRADRALARLEALVDRLVTRTFPAR